MTHDASPSAPRTASPSRSRGAAKHRRRRAPESSERFGSRIAVVDPARFLLATRDSGYRSTTHAIAEFIDNAIQAGAKNIAIRLRASSDGDTPEVLVIDDGKGMDVGTLHSALTFGGSSRFNDRQGLGRYGIGLPNGALSIARRVDVYSWQGKDVHMCSLDLDDFLDGGKRTLGTVQPVDRPNFVPTGRHGTAVRLTKCDQLGYKRLGFLRRRLVDELGTIYRHYLTEGLRLEIDEVQVFPVDPLFLMPTARLYGATQFGNTLRYTLPGAHSSGEVTVRFSELPVEDWFRAPNKQKRRFGITNAVTVSVVRAGREIDAGWLFMGEKRRENYDDWWRCEVCFDPALDETFGVTYTKQGIRPSEDLLAVLSKDLEPIARALSKRVRERFEAVKAGTALSLAEERATRASEALPPLPNRRDEFPSDFRPVPYIGDIESPDARYRIRVADIKGTNAYETLLHEGNVLVLINRRHPFYRDLYAPLADAEARDGPGVAQEFALMLLAAGHAELVTPEGRDRTAIRAFRQRWDDVLATFLND